MSKPPQPPAPGAAAAPSAWRAPTRRSFLAMIGVGAAALAVRERVAAPAAPPSVTVALTGKLRWIGHC